LFHRLPRWLVAGGAVVLFALAFSFAFHAMFARMLSLDEGYLMITIRGFLDGHALYDPLFTQYGPAYYLYQWLARGLLHIPLTHDATRWLGIFHWLAASVVLGLAGRRLTGSSMGGLFAFALAVVHLSELANEPGHPQELVIVLTALGALAATRARAMFGPIEWLALITAGLFFTKINVGVFFGLALALALGCEIYGRYARTIKLLLLAGCLGIPFLLMRRHLGLEWCRSYGAVVAAALGGTCLLAWRHSGETPLTRRDFLKAAACFLIPAGLFAGFALVTGSAPRALLDGLIITPLQMPALVLMPLPISGLALFNGLVSLAVAVFFVWRQPAPKIAVLLKTAYALAGAFVCIGKPVQQLALMLPWVWLVLLPFRRTDEPMARLPFARLFLCFATGAEAMQAYPVAGTQIANGTFLLVLTYALCLNDALRNISLAKITDAFAKLRPTSQLGLQTSVVLALVVVFTNVWCDLPSVRRAYAAAAPLNLPGSKAVRMQPGAVALFQDLSHYLRTESDSFISYPCLNSLYFWTEQAPPTQLNGTGWLQFDPAQQQRILDALLMHSRPRLVLPTKLVQSWSQQAPLLLRPLVDCVTQQCEAVTNIGPYTVFSPKPGARTSLAAGN
jgi:hypothetical protein